MGSSPSIPQYKAPSGAPSYISTPGIDINQLQGAYQNALNPAGSTNIANIWNQSGLAGLPNAQGINSPEGQAVAADVIGYQMSDADLAQRYPWLMQARDTYGGFLNDLLSNTTPQSIAQGQQTMQAGQALSNSGLGMLGTGQNVIQQGEAFLPQAQGLITQGQGYLGTANNIIGEGQGLASQSQYFIDPASQLAAQAQGVGQQDIDLGQQMINGQAMDPIVQQELMRAGLTSAAGALGGAAALGGTAGQAAVGRQLGVGAQNWINQQRTLGQALQTTGAGLTSSYGNTAASLAGAGSGVANAGSSLIGAGTGVGGLGTSVIGAGTNVGGLGSTLMNTGANIYGQGTNAIGTGANAVSQGQGVINSAAQNANATFGEASALFQPRTFGLTGADAANVSLANTAGVNNMNQYLYSTKVQGAQYNSQIAGANASAQSQATGNLISGGTSVAASAAVVGLAISCHIARLVYGPCNPQWKVFRHWMMNIGPRWFRRLYLDHSREAALWMDDKPLVKTFVKAAMDIVTHEYSHLGSVFAQHST